MWIRIMAAVALAVLVAGCGDRVEFTEQGGVIEAEVETSDRAALSALRDLTAESRERWQAQAIDSYEIDYSSLGFWDCHDVATLSVAPGRDPQLTPGPCDGDHGFHTPTYTIDELFDLVERATTGEDRAELVTAWFDAELGYPHRVYVDWQVQLPDEEVGASVAGFRPAP